MLKVGDKVLWAGCWDHEPQKEVTVTGLEINRCGKEGDPVDSASWEVVKETGIVSLDNGHWAYGYQLNEVVTCQS